jgi:hypothetical protein
MKNLPCADCGLVITVRVKQDRTADGVPILCDQCLRARVEQIRAGWARKGHAVLTETPKSPHDILLTT